MKPIRHPDLTTKEGIYPITLPDEGDGVRHWFELYHDGIFEGYFNTRGVAEEKYEKLKENNKKR